MRTKLILETGCNHQGSVDIAKEMIDLAAKLGAWGVKFQKRDIESFSEELKRKPRDLRNSFGYDYYQHRKKLEFSPWQIKELKEHAEAAGLQFVCSVFDLNSINDLLDIGCSWIKLPSQYYSDQEMHDALHEARRRKDFKVIVSTGMHSEEEVLNSEWMINADIILHCISTYPVKEDKYFNLGMIRKLRRHASGEIGYSSHGPTGHDTYNAVLAGADYIERHFTLCKNLKGSDHGTVSSDYQNVKILIHDILYAEELLGDGRIISEEEKAIARIYRRNT